MIRKIEYCYKGKKFEYLFSSVLSMVIGPNGSGKTSVMQTVAVLLCPGYIGFGSIPPFANLLDAFKIVFENGFSVLYKQQTVSILDENEVVLDESDFCDYAKRYGALYKAGLFMCVDFITPMQLTEVYGRKIIDEGFAKKYFLNSNFDEDASFGNIQLARILAPLFVKPAIPHIIIVDLPETGLHIEWQEKLIDAYMAAYANGGFTHAFFITHSPNILNGHFECLVERTVSDCE